MTAVEPTTSAGAARVSAMVQVAIRCHPRAPVPAEEFASWLEREVAELRAEAAQGTVRLSSLTQHLPNTDVDIGWLLELEVSDDDPLLQDRRLNSILRDMRLLGLTPTLLMRSSLRDGHQVPSTSIGKQPIIGP